MKKLFVFFSLIVFSVVTFGQALVTGNEIKTYYISTTTTKLPYNINSGNLIFVGSTGKTYFVNTIAKAGTTPTSLSNSGTISIWAAASTTYYVDTATAQNIYGIKKFYSAPATVRGTTNKTTNTGFGLSAINAMTTGANNVGVGNSALSSNTTGSANTAVGFGSLGTTVSTIGSTAVGYASLAASTGAKNTALGYAALNYNTTGTENVGIGYNTNAFKTTGDYNTVIGSNALLNNGTGSGNIAVGYAAGYYEMGSNKLTISNKVGGQDTAIIYGSMGANPAENTLQLNASVSIYGTMTGGSLMRGSANFTATQKVVKIYVPGLADTDHVFFTPYQTDSTSAVLAADNLNAYLKTDTLVVVRPGSGTSGLKFDWFRVK